MDRTSRRRRNPTRTVSGEGRNTVLSEQFRHQTRVDMNILARAMPSKIMIDADFIRLSIKELELFKAQDDRVAMTYEAIMGNVVEAEPEKRSKKETIKLLLAIGNLNKLYFIVRSGMMTLISGLAFLIATILLGTIGAFHVVILGLLCFILSLFISRLTDRLINRGTTRIITFLDIHERLKERILRNL